jgi:16S rRNA G527 N7-methylase RsmG
MSEQADLDELARRYLDLWQDQMTALAGDREFTEALQQLMTTMGMAGEMATAAAPQFQRAWWGMMTGQQPSQQTEASADDGTGGRAPGAPAAAAAPDGGGLDLDQLARRLATLEQRIAALEAGVKRGRGGAAGKSRKPRP